ncbi:MCE family protein [Actinocrispum wychmicini]|uniref:Virulence factor Mce-like protein n=1 Tax=Actinocrispum wychmicini TaxID=1213861 RepID=A0A4R2JZB6_9PSEU|nr:MCE family protein [Actinocrispum wychmicini]TCO65314.1 virulence factor Mce-like protein [Actinocrispum wychmicini]
MTTLRRRLLGVAFIAMLVGFVALSIAFFNKSFNTYVNVGLTTDSIGNQLQERSDVKVRGLIVGSVKSVKPTTRGAELTLALDPDKAAVIPSNVSAQFLPKTLFGERYVALQIPDEPAARTLRTGDMIQQDRSTKAIEVQKALNDLLPVLQAVQPEKLSSTLTAISTALQGRGKALGQTLADLGSYVGEVNPYVPQLQHDLQALVGVSNTYSDAAPQLIQALDDLTVTSKTIAEQKANLSTLYGSLTTASTDLKTFLQVNKNNLIQFADTSRPTMELLARYAPEYPCFLRQMAETVKSADVAFGKGTNEPGLHATLEITVNRGPYKAGQDEPRYDDKRGPRCYDFQKFPVPFPQHPPDGPLKDGSKSPPNSRPANDGVLPPANIGSVIGGTAPSSAGQDFMLPGSRAEADFVAAIMGQQLGVRPDDVPTWTAVLVAPVFRGAEVNVK